MSNETSRVPPVTDPAPVPPAGRPTLDGLARVFLRISMLGFGGPNAHIALMLDEVVERRRWISREHFLHLVAITNLLPGPNSSEVAIHIGYTQRGWRGGLATGLAFIAPTFFLVVVLSFLYFRFGTLPAVHEILWGLKPVVVAIILAAGWKLGRTVLTDWVLAGLAASGIAVAMLLDRWEVAAMAVGGVVGWLVYGRTQGDDPEAGPAPTPQSMHGRGRGFLLLLPALALPAASELARLFGLMLWAGSVLFGGGYMLVALLRPYVVDHYAWLTPQQFLDGIAITQALPGPIVTLVAFVGYAVAGLAGATVAMVGIYLPSFVAVFGVAPYLERWRHRGSVNAVLKGVNAVVAGAILGVGITLIVPAVPDFLALGLFVVALIAHLRFGVGAIWLVVAGLFAGVAMYGVYGVSRV